MQHTKPRRGWNPEQASWPQTFLRDNSGNAKFRKCLTPRFLPAPREGRVGPRKNGSAPLKTGLFDQGRGGKGGDEPAHKFLFYAHRKPKRPTIKTMVHKIEEEDRINFKVWEGRGEMSLTFFYILVFWILNLMEFVMTLQSEFHQIKVIMQSFDPSVPSPGKKY